MNSAVNANGMPSLPFSQIIDNLDSLSKSQIANVTLNNQVIERNVNSFIKSGMNPIFQSENKGWLHQYFPTKLNRKSIHEFDLFLV